ncbi:putative reverse transcriptase domain-containing protein [Tanacetum coccineum]
MGYENHSQINTQYGLPLLLPYFKPIQPHTQDRYEPLDDDTELVSKDESEISEQWMSDNIDNDKPLAPKPQHEELCLKEDLDEWLKTKIEKRMVRQDKESEEDALINILKSLVKECKVVYKGTSYHGTNEIQGGSIAMVKEERDILETLRSQLSPKELNPGIFILPCTIGNLNLYAMTDLGASINIMSRSIFEHLKLTDLNKTDMTVVMADMTEKTPL